MGETARMADLGDDVDFRIRMAAFGFLSELRRTLGTEMPRQVLARGFDFGGQRVPLLGPQGIWKPAAMPEMPLSITTVPPTNRKDQPYDDELGSDGVLAYRYRGTDPNHRDNVGLRLAMKRQVPLVYFFGTVEGWYEAIWPVFVGTDDLAHRTFTMVVDQQGRLLLGVDEPESAVADRRRYVTREVQQRLHQRVFRGQVIRAYATRCSICRLRRRELLEAAHILGDAASGQPIVPNGLAMCSLHHTAFDTNVIGISPDYVIHVREDVLADHDGPMLRHGLQGFEQEKLILPHRPEDRPDRTFLETRFDAFRRAS